MIDSDGADKKKNDQEKKLHEQRKFRPEETNERKGNMSLTMPYKIDQRI